MTLIRSLLSSLSTIIISISLLSACGGGGGGGGGKSIDSSSSSSHSSPHVSSQNSSSHTNSSQYSSSQSTPGSSHSSVAGSNELPAWVQNPNTLVNNGIAGSLNGAVLTIYHSGENDSFAEVERGLLFVARNNTGDFWSIGIDEPLEVNRDYACDSQGSISLALNLEGSAYYLGSRCRISLSTIEKLANGLIDYIDGVFVVELTDGDNNQQVVSDGRFRYDVN